MDDLSRFAYASGPDGAVYQIREWGWKQTAAGIKVTVEMVELISGLDRAPRRIKADWRDDVWSGFSLALRYRRSNSWTG